MAIFVLFIEALMRDRVSGRVGMCFSCEGASVKSMPRAKSDFRVVRGKGRCMSKMPSREIDMASLFSWARLWEFEHE
jgi:hypothetical protein